jgi:PAS domain S-box-containing protein
MNKEDQQDRMAYLEKLVEQQNAEINRLNGELNTASLDIYEHSARQLERFQQVVTQSRSMFIFMDPGGNIEYINDRLTQILGYTKEDLIGTNHDFTVQDESGNNFRNQVAQGLMKAGFYSGELQVRKKDGGKIWVKGTMAVLYKNNQPDCIVAVMEDISDEIELKRQALDYQVMMSSIMENATVSITLMDYNGYFTFFNKMAEKHLRFTPEDLRTKPVSELFPDEGPRTLESIRQIFKTKKPVHIETVYNIHGKDFTFDINRLPLFRSDGEVYNIMSISTDITERKYTDRLSKIYHAIDSLHSIGETFEDSIKILFDNLFKFEWIDAGGLYMVNHDKKILELVFHTGLSDEFARDTSVYEFDSDNARVAFNKVPRYVTMDAYLTSTKENVHKEKITFIAVLPLVYQDKVLGLLNLASRKVFSIDATDREALETIAMKIGNLLELIKTRMELDRSNKQLTGMLKELQVNQQILIQKSRLESLGELSAGLAHEINQPLSVMSLAMENVFYKLQQKAATEDYLTHKFKTINQNINKIRELIDHVRIFSRDQGTIMFEQVDVNQVINNALSMISSQLRNRNISVTTELTVHVGYTLGNPSRLEQVFLNLLSNSRDALEEKEKKSGFRGNPMKIEIKTAVKENKILISFRDNGAGISKENLQRIFNPFFTTKSTGHGTGLGLPIVYGIIREMKGEISAKSEQGSYTEISITLPHFKINDSNRFPEEIV